MPDSASLEAAKGMPSKLPVMSVRWWRHQSPAMLAGSAILVFWTVIAVLGPVLSPYTQTDLVSEQVYGGPDLRTLLGTDRMGRDILSCLIYGARTTLGIALVATALSHLFGVSLGFLAGVRGGLIDSVLSRLNDVLLSIPHIMIGLVVVAALGSSIPVIVVCLGVMYASGVFRIARALAADIKVMPFVDAARARREPVHWILFGEILPNVLNPLLTDFVLRLSFVILMLSSLSFLGLGVQPPATDWGSMVRDNMDGLPSGSLAPIIPAAAIASVTVALNVVVDEMTSRADRTSGKRAQ